MTKLSKAQLKKMAALYNWARLEYNTDGLLLWNNNIRNTFNWRQVPDETIQEFLALSPEDQEIFS